MKEVYDYLDNLDIKYEIVNHREVFTTKEADECIKDKIGVRTKTMFIYNQNKTHFYLLILDEQRLVDFKALQELLKEKKLKFASEEYLDKKLGLKSGSISIFGLLNNQDKDIKVLFDKSSVSDIPLTFHPNINTATIFIKFDDIIKFLDSLKVSYSIIEM